MATNFNELAHNVVTARKNWGAPEDFKLRECVPKKEYEGKTITIDSVVVMNKLKRDKETKEIVKTKDGKDMYEPIVYVAYGGDKFLVSKSAILVEQLERFSGKKLVAYEKKDFVVGELEGVTVKLTNEKVKYRDGKEYDQLIFADAE